MCPRLIKIRSVTIEIRRQKRKKERNNYFCSGVCVYCKCDGQMEQFHSKCF